MEGNEFARSLKIEIKHPNRGSNAFFPLLRERVGFDFYELFKHANLTNKAYFTKIDEMRPLFLSTRFTKRAASVLIFEREHVKKTCFNHDTE